MTADELPALAKRLRNCYTDEPHEDAAAALLWAHGEMERLNERGENLHAKWRETEAKLISARSSGWRAGVEAALKRCHSIYQNFPPDKDASAALECYEAIRALENPKGEQATESIVTGAETLRASRPASPAGPNAAAQADPVSGIASSEKPADSPVAAAPEWVSVPRELLNNWLTMIECMPEAEEVGSDAWVIEKQMREAAAPKEPTA